MSLWKTKGSLQRRFNSASSVTPAQGLETEHDKEAEGTKDRHAHTRTLRQRRRKQNDAVDSAKP